MGAGDLNMKKSWHPMLHSNQEKVWLQEQEAIKERKRLEELRKEREHERQMQELQRIHEQAGGKKRVERVEWMYATPAAKGEPSAAELEDYLLGKKRVDKLLQGNEAEALSRNAELGKSDTSDALMQRDMATKIREDPLLAIKQQEQAVYEMLMKDPSKLRQMRAKMGLEPDRSERSRSQRREHGSNRSTFRDRTSRSDRDGYSDRKERSPSRDDRRDSRHIRRLRETEHRFDDSPYDRRQHRHDASPAYSIRRQPYDRECREGRDDRRYKADRASRDTNFAYQRQHPHYNGRRTQRDHTHSPVAREDSAREAKLAAMMADAKAMNEDRSARLDKIDQEERLREDQEQKRRDATHDQSQWRSGGGTGKASFLLEQQQQHLWGEQHKGMDLHERLRRTRQGLQRVGADD
ncbi:RNA-splicing factor [Malassezia psittaci]|uniref:RNA-splicing factor n=1 Tax=Malassezia psittaci TaxID=1821823 RepID=A0AAF0JCS8_9BASI|nr:RNA-splicing factor [Malassezia psittaci]